MNCLVVYDTVYGNTEQVARAIAAALSPIHLVRLIKADQIVKLDAASIDLLFVGRPTHRHRMSPKIAAVLKATPRGTLKGVKVAAQVKSSGLQNGLSKSSTVSRPAKRNPPMLEVLCHSANNTEQMVTTNGTRIHIKRFDEHDLESKGRL